MRYKTKIQDIAVGGLFLSLSILFSLISGSYIPKVPFINGHIDLWYGISILGIFAIKSLDIKIIYIMSLPFGLMITELSSYPNGIGDYFIECGIPLLFLFIFLPISYIKNKIILLSLIVLGIGVWSSIRFLGQTYAGVYFYGVNWKASAIFNAPNSFGDLIGIYPIVIMGVLFLISIKNSRV